MGVKLCNSIQHMSLDELDGTFHLSFFSSSLDTSVFRISPSHYTASSSSRPPFVGSS